MASVRRTVTLPLAFVVCLLVVAGVAVTPAVAAGESLAAVAPQDTSAVEASLTLDHATRRLIQQRLRNEGFDPGTPDGLFGPRTRAAIREWQQSRGTSPTGHLNGAEAELLRTATAPPPATPATPPPPQAVPASAAILSSLAPPLVSTPQADSNPPRAPVATEADLLNAAETNTQQPPRAAAGTGTVQLPPEILVDRHLVRVERLLADDDPAAALEAMNEVLALQQEYDLVLQDGFRFQYAQVAYSAGRTEMTIAVLNEYLVVAGREGEFYREALELLDSAELRLQQEETERRRARRRAEAERRRAEAERRHAARWPPGHVFRDCETCPQMVVLRGSVVALGQYEVTVGEYRAFASATGLGAADCDGNSWRNPGFPQTDHHPVTCVSWDEAQTYVSWLSRQTGAPYRLPTEAEWELAAAGSQPGCDVLGNGTAPGRTCPVGQYGTNATGLSDMIGNVWEWTSDCWEGDCRRRVLRGGSWGNHPDYLQPDSRGWSAADNWLVTLGIRVARTLE